MESEWFAAATKSSAMGVAAMRFPWESTPLGPMSTWDPSLRQAVKLCFSTRFPVMIAWGPELIMIYNDAYREMLGTDKRLSALGAPLRKVWSEVWEDLTPFFDSVLLRAEPTWSVDIPLLMNRSSFDEETFFTFSYSPLFDVTGAVGGVLDIASETTESVVDRRRLATIDALHQAMAEHRGDLQALVRVVVEVLGASADVSRCALHLATGENLELAASSGASLADDVPAEVLERVLGSREPTVLSPVFVAPLAHASDPTAIGVLVVEGNLQRPFDASQRSFLMVVSAAVGAALSATVALQTHLDHLSAQAEIAELRAGRLRESSVTLQQSMLTPPPSPSDLDITVRYQPAAEDSEIGGDWYDAFVTQDGATMLVVGDVTGHDHHAAAAMGQLRGLIRAIAFDTGLSPARVLERTDRAITGLGLGPAATATAVVVRIEAPSTTAGHARSITWSNAGHPAPVLVCADGQVRQLKTRNDLLLGITARTVRTDHSADLAPGDTLFLYTDGLIERRGASMAERTALLLESLAGGHELALDALSDHVLADLSTGPTDDDVALVLLRLMSTTTPQNLQLSMSAAAQS